VPTGSLGGEGVGEGCSAVTEPFWDLPSVRPPCPGPSLSSGLNAVS
jgi:hypothetical protein